MTHLEHGRACFARRAWRDAYQSLRSADESAPLEVDDLDRLATAAYLIGRGDEYRHVLERLYHAHLESADRARAARCCFWLALMSVLRGDAGQTNAWIARGEHLVENHDCVECGYLAIAVAEQHLRDGRTEVAYAAAEQAAAIARAFHDADLTAAATHLEGRALIQQGQVVAGLKRLDETMLAVVAGELLPIMTGSLYCSVIDVCRQVCALGRAREWTAAFSVVCEQQPDMDAFTGICRVHRAEIMQVQGAWPDALAEACRACERAEQAGGRPPGAAKYQQGEIFRLRGEFVKAEEAYQAASEFGFEPQPGLALLRLAQGRVDAACRAIRRLMGATTEGTVSVFPDRRLPRAGLLPAQFEIVLASGDLDEARHARDQLRELAEAFDSDMLRAAAAQADGALAIAEGRAHAALDPLRRAFDLWDRLEAPHAAARVRVLIGTACRALGDRDTAELEFRVARAVFERLGARPDVTRLEMVVESAPPIGKPVLTGRELQVLRMIATGHTNREIAEEFSLSERTIDRHVSNILTKLDVRSRTAAASYAFHHKLI